MNKEAAIHQINSLASSGTPFLMIADFKCAKNHIYRLDQIDPSEILFNINGVGNFDSSIDGSMTVQMKRSPISFDTFKNKFDHVHKEIAEGNTYLLNLTQPTPVSTDIKLQDIFYRSKAKYKLWYKDQFVVFSPEIFVKIINGEISSYPMKGTIDADLPHAAELLMSSEKEMAEHATIVDLIRNDMSQFAKHVRVEDFRYIDEIRTSEKHLLQVSSKITGQLDSDHLDYLGDIVYSLLPAGSICGAPKHKTLEIIDQVEGYERGYYTGIVGYFDGRSFDSGVMIRYIENQGEKMIYKSGGGIHFLSDAEAEYQEMIDKVYVPVH